METKIQNQPNIEEAQFDSSENKNLSIAKVDESKIAKTSDTMDSLDTSLQKQPEVVSKRQTEIEEQLNKLAEVNNTLIGRFLIPKGEKQLLKIDAKASQEALQIIRTGQNNNLAAVADYQLRYLKTILHNLTLVGESNMIGASKLHYETIKQAFHEKLLNKMEEMTHLLESLEEKAKRRPEKFKKAILDATNRVLIQWSKDFDQHLNEFSELLKKTFSR